MLGKRTLFDWQDSPPPKPTAPIGTPEYQTQKEEYDAARWTDRLCEIMTETPVVRGMLEQPGPNLGKVPISFVESLPGGSFAQYNIQKKEIVLNAEVIRNLSEEGDGYFSELSFNCLFSIFHELRHAYQYGRLKDPWIAAFGHENMSLVTAYNELVLEADATAFALTGMYDLVANPEIHGLGNMGFERVMANAPEGASLKAFKESISDSVYNFYNGAAQQAAFKAYFSDQNNALTNSYVQAAILKSEDFRPEEPRAVSNAFGSAAGLKVFEENYAFMRHMPSIERNDADIERNSYLEPWPLSPNEFLRAVGKPALQEMGFTFG